MKIELAKDEQGVGARGDIVEVSDKRGLRWIDKGMARLPGAIEPPEEVEPAPKPKPRKAKK